MEIVDGDSTNVGHDNNFSRIALKNQRCADLIHQYHESIFWR